VKPHEIEGALKSEPTTACSGRRFAPPLMLGVGQRKNEDFVVGRPIEGE